LRKMPARRDFCEWASEMDKLSQDRWNIVYISPPGDKSPGEFY